MPNFAKINVYGTGPKGQRVLLVAKGDEIPSGIDGTVSGGNKTADRSEALGLPILTYDALSQAEILDKLEALDSDDRATILAYERANAGRDAILHFGQHGGAAIVLETTMPATATAVDADQSIGEVPSDGTVVGVTYIAEAAIAGANTDSRTLQVVNKGQDGTGTTVIATLPLLAGVSAAAFDERAVTLTGTLGDRAVNAGDVLVWKTTHVGSGLADPGGHVSVKIAAD